MAVTTFRKDPTTGDVAFPIELISGPEAVGQHLSERLRMFLGEWFLDTREGVSYFRDILIKGIDLSVARSIFRRTILGAQDVAELKELVLTPDYRNRNLAVSFIAVTVEGDVLDTSRLDTPFIITIP